MSTKLVKLNQRNQFDLVLSHKISLKQTIQSHGWVNLAPWHWDATKHELSRVEQLDEQATATVSMSQISGHRLRIKVHGSLLGPEGEQSLENIVTRWISGDWDPTPFTQLALRLDVQISRFVEGGGGRFLRGSTFFEDFAKTIFTINANWAYTKRMVTEIISTTDNHTFPTPLHILTKGERYLKTKLRLGFRSKVLFRTTAMMVDLNIIDAKGIRTKTPLTYEGLLELNGIGPYCASHMLFLEHDFLRIPIDSEVSRYCMSQLGIVKNQIPAFFEEWGEYAQLGYKLGRILREDVPV